ILKTQSTTEPRPLSTVTPKLRTFFKTLNPNLSRSTIPRSLTANQSSAPVSFSSPAAYPNAGISILPYETRIQDQITMPPAPSIRRERKESLGAGLALRRVDSPIVAADLAAATSSSGLKLSENEDEKLERPVTPGASFQIGDVKMSAPVFVTGGSRFVRCRLIAHLLSKGIPVVALSRSPASDEVIRAIDPSAADSIRLVRGDLHADATVLAEEMRGVATVYPRRRTRTHSNVDGTRNIVGAAKLAGMKQFVHCSTCAVYLRNEHSPVRTAAEKSRLDPMRTLRNSQMIWCLKRTKMWLPGLIKAIKENQLKKFTPSGYFVSTTNIENLCDAFLLAAKNGRPGHAYNVIDSQDIQFEEFVERLVLVGSKLRSQH
ncbi:hypothetical protein HDU99_008440, partial [Rhizoclosmatium hyalinum]